MSETDIHKNIKTELFWSFAEDQYYVSTEKKLGKTVADVLTKIGNFPIAIEIQYTRISLQAIIQRMKEHTKLGFYTLWLIPQDAFCFDNGVRSLNWILSIQRLQNGVLFLPSNQHKVIPARIDNSLCLQNSEITAGKKWLDIKEEIDIENLCFEKNELGLNIATYPEVAAWDEEYFTFMDEFL